MLAYRTHIYSLAMEASAAATKLALALSDFLVDRQIDSDSQSAVDRHLPELKIRAHSLRSTVDNLREALPAEVRDGIHNINLGRHIWFIDYWLNKRSPASCIGDPIDIVSNDLPNALELFERWYERQSPTHNGLGVRVNPQIENGQLNSAIRDAWPFFKTRMVDLFELSDDLDGEKLATKLFGSAGATMGLIPNREREGYMNLFKGLYALSRNPVLHNDLDTNPEYTSAVLGLINSTLTRVEAALDQSNTNNTENLSS